jgi:hypothetical protein
MNEQEPTFQPFIYDFCTRTSHIIATRAIYGKCTPYENIHTAYYNLLKKTSSHFIFVIDYNCVRKHLKVM